MFSHVNVGNISLDVRTPHMSSAKPSLILLYARSNSQQNLKTLTVNTYHTKASSQSKFPRGTSSLSAGKVSWNPGNPLGSCIQEWSREWRRWKWASPPPSRSQHKEWVVETDTSPAPKDLRKERLVQRVFSFLRTGCQVLNINFYFVPLWLLVSKLMQTGGTLGLHSPLDWHR